MIPDLGSLCDATNPDCPDEVLGRWMLLEYKYRHVPPTGSTPAASPVAKRHRDRTREPSKPAGPTRPAATAVDDTAEDPGPQSPGN